MVNLPAHTERPGVDEKRLRWRPSFTMVLVWRQQSKPFKYRGVKESKAMGSALRSLPLWCGSGISCRIYRRNWQNLASQWWNHSPNRTGVTSRSLVASFLMEPTLFNISRASLQLYGQPNSGHISQSSEAEIETVDRRQLYINRIARQ